MLASGSVALGQVPVRPGGAVPITRPTTSPYLNLNRAGVPPAINYYGLVRPELAFRGSIQNLQTQVDTNRQLITTGSGGTGTAGVLTTGHSAVFLNNGGYFLNQSGGTPGGGRGTAGPAAGAGAGPERTDLCPEGQITLTADALRGVGVQVHRLEMRWADVECSVTPHQPTAFRRVLSIDHHLMPAVQHAEDTVGELL